MGIKCYICGIGLSRLPLSHVINCAKRNNITDNAEVLRQKHLEFSFCINKAKVKQLLSNKIPVKVALIELNNIDLKSYYFLLNVYGLKLSNVDSEAARKHNYEKTCLLKYGLVSSNSLPTTQNNKRNTLTSKYGVDNPAKVKLFVQKAIQTKLKNNNGKYPNPFSNKTEEEKNAILNNAWAATKKRWSSYSEAEKQKYVDLLRTNHKIWYYGLSEKEKTAYIESRTVKFQSNLEKQVANKLTENHINFVQQKWINRKSYDFLIADTKLLIEVQGDYWHCNPNIYGPEDIVQFPIKSVTAYSIWEKDRLKKQNAESYGYQIFYVWESDINSEWISELKDIIKQVCKQ